VQLAGDPSRLGQLREVVACRVDLKNDRIVA
jgi:hypothetical protein